MYVHSIMYMDVPEVEGAPDETLMEGTGPPPPAVLDPGVPPLFP